MDGLNENQSVRKIQEILKELGIEGKPSLEQCKVIKSRREFEAELKEIDTSNIIEGKRRSSGVKIVTLNNEIQKKSVKRRIISDDDQSSEAEDAAGSGTDDDDDDDGIEIDLNAFGDSESD